MTPEAIEALQTLAESLASDAEVKRRELELQAQWQEQNFEYARRALEAQLSDREQERAHDWRKAKLRYGFAASTVLIAVAFLVFAALTDNQQLALDFVKFAFGALTGGGIMYGYSRSKASRSGESP